MKLLKIGELAKLAGVTVRTLHHYDRLGLLQATANRESGHRLYTSKDVERLQQILSFKSMGFSLEAIQKCLDGDAYDLKKTLKLQESLLLQNLEDMQHAYRSLRALLHKMDAGETPSLDEFFTFQKEVEHMKNYYTAEQLEYLKNRYEQYADKAKEVEKAWPVLFAKFEEAQKAGLAPNHLKVQVLVKEAEHYIDLFTGGDKEIRANLERMNAETPEIYKQWGISKELYAYIQEARRLLKA